MKRTVAILALLTAALCARAADNVTTNYFPGYQYIPGTNTDVGTTAIATGTAYVVFPLAGLTDLTEAQASETAGDVRAVMYGILQTYYAAYTASTNKSQSTATLTQGYSTSTTNVYLDTTHSILTRKILGAGALP